MIKIYTFMLWLFSVVQSLRLTRINIPQYKFRGENAILECDYELNGNRDSEDDDDGDNVHFNYQDVNDVETLYSVKW